MAPVHCRIESRCLTWLSINLEEELLPRPCMFEHHIEVQQSFQGKERLIEIGHGQHRARSVAFNLS